MKGKNLRPYLERIDALEGPVRWIDECWHVYWTNPMIRKQGTLLKRTFTLDPEAHVPRAITEDIKLALEADAVIKKEVIPLKNFAQIRHYCEHWLALFE